VLVETLAAELTLTQPQEIELYAKVFDRLAGVAKYSLEARRIIVGVLERMDSDTENRAPSQCDDARPRWASEAEPQ
jgi:hypothetical protein